MPKTITLDVDEQVFDRVHAVAARRRTTVDGLVRDYLARVAAADAESSPIAARVAALRGRSRLEVGPPAWTRDDLHDR